MIKDAHNVLRMLQCSPDCVLSMRQMTVLSCFFLNFRQFAHLPRHLLEILFEALQAKPPAMCMDASISRHLCVQNVSV